MISSNTMNSIFSQPMSLAWVILTVGIASCRAMYIPTSGIDEKGESKSVQDPRTIAGYKIGDRQFEATSDTILRKKQRGSRTSQWVVTSSDATCEINLEGIKPSGWRSDVTSEVSCQDHCLKRANCVAVDYIPGHKLCAFYNEACTTPQKTPKKNEGGVSSHLERMGSWVAVDATKPCHHPKGPEQIPKQYRDHDGIGLVSKQKIETLEQCQDSCLRRANCMSVDFFENTKLCNMYNGVCSSSFEDEMAGKVPESIEMLRSEPDFKGSSWRLNLDRGVSGLSMAEMKRFGDWVAISTDKACARSGDGVEADFMIRTKSLEECQTKCEHRSQCVAVDYYNATGNCNQYTEACLSPRDARNGASSYRIERKGLQWKAIDQSRACEENNEGIGFISHRLNVPEMSECKDMCLRKADCVAFDFFRELGSCSLYNEACTGPLAQRHGAMSFELERKDVVVEAAPESQTGEGFSVQKGMKLRLW